MSDKDTKSDSIQYATLENVNKCIDNAFRLYDDASKTSTPTKAALIELGIEELAKGLLITFKTSEFEKQSLSWSLYDDSIFTGQKGNNFKESLEQYKIVDFTTHRHDKKLDLIQFVFKKAEELYSNNKTDLGLIFDIILKYYEQYFQKSNEGPFNMLDKGFSFLKGINITKLFEKKNDGFYVNFKNGKAIAPKDEPFQINELISVFVITYLLLNIILNYLDGFDLTSPKTDLKKLLGKIYDMLPDYVKKSLSDIDE